MLIECVPNFSEGARPDIVEAIVAKVRAESSARVLDLQSDASHNRSVLTLAGDADSLFNATLALVGACLAVIDLRTHRGEHPRMGAVDVVPFIPLEGATIKDCVALARRTGEAIAKAHNVPVFLYEEAASAPHRKGLEDIRRGQFEGLEAKLKDPQWKPDFGPAEPHPSFGAVVVGARMPLIAFNVNLNTDDVEIAKKIAKGIRHSTGGYRFVKAMGLIVDINGRKVAQVSMNMTDFTKTPLFRVTETIRNEAARYGVAIAGSEIVGLVPVQALIDSAEHYLQLTGFSNAQVLETRLRSE
ncbi:MAG: glutamate formimidoyltransferase [Vicinamibacteria bacterium]|nr:glutamate formimidoyltransferase [Vicinamibacteria bacterium]